eukprot:CAMPEP_0172905746 /NCGR_PEP_ID=MMETSP1075-20121228/175346_1 /TAXON_ID=2916 /ORGANISM="Ceratium fusus, Strain PA161109" /LENGTH=55 /DNA_ID=CAMNT_0013763047 /DNA_START=65 /DNA_END=230 /DNA_ORIENTATION=-
MDPPGSRRSSSSKSSCLQAGRTILATSKFLGCIAKGQWEQQQLAACCSDAENATT